VTLLLSVITGGDSDTTAAIGGAWFGALYGFAKVPKNNYSNLEYGESLDLLAKQLLIFSGKAS
jgi:ADP-ribosylglycohydrolase